MTAARKGEVWWDMVLEWDKGCHHDDCRQQKLGFKHRDSFLSATRQANKLRLMMTRGCGVPPASCRIVYIGQASALEKYLAERTAYTLKADAEHRARVKDVIDRPVTTRAGAKKTKLKVRKALSKTHVSSTGGAFRVRDHDH